MPRVDNRQFPCGILYRPDEEKFIEFYIYTEFADVWAHTDAYNSENFMLCTGYVIEYTVCPVLWYNKLQKKITLSKTEAEYTAFIQVLRKLINLMALMKEVYFIFDIHLPNPEVFCKVFEENQIYIAVAESIKLSRRTNHITIKYHHF